MIPDLVAPLNVASLAESVSNAALDMRRTMGQEFLQQQQTNIQADQARAHIDQVNALTDALKYDLAVKAPLETEKAKALLAQTQAQTQEYLTTMPDKIAQARIMTEGLAATAKTQAADAALKGIEVTKAQEAVRNGTVAAQQQAALTGAGMMAKNAELMTNFAALNADKRLTEFQDQLRLRDNLLQANDFSGLKKVNDRINELYPTVKPLLDQGKAAAKQLDGYELSMTGKSGSRADSFRTIMNGNRPIVLDKDPSLQPVFSTTMGGVFGVKDKSGNDVQVDTRRTIEYNQQELGQKLRAMDSDTVAAVHKAYVGMPEDQKQKFLEYVHELPGLENFTMDPAHLIERTRNVISQEVMDAPHTSSFAEFSAAQHLRTKYQFTGATIPKLFTEPMALALTGLNQDSTYHFITQHPVISQTLSGATSDTRAFAKLVQTLDQDYLSVYDKNSNGERQKQIDYLRPIWNSAMGSLQQKVEKNTATPSEQYQLKRYQEMSGLLDQMENHYMTDARGMHGVRVAAHTYQMTEVGRIEAQRMGMTGVDQLYGWAQQEAKKRGMDKDDPDQITSGLEHGLHWIEPLKALKQNY